MEVKNAEGLADGRKVLVGLKRKRAVRCAAYFIAAATSPKLSPNKRCKRATSEGYRSCCRCCSGKSLLRNYMNFMKSGLPQRVMYYQTGEWDDMPVDCIHIFKEAFKCKKTVVEVVFQSQCTLVDFSYMTMFDLKRGFQRPIAWIDESGRCFFPELFSESSYECIRCYADSGKEEHYKFPEPNGTREIEIHCNIDISGTNGSKAEDRKIYVSDAKHISMKATPEGDMEAVQDKVACSNTGIEIKEAMDESGSFELATRKSISPTSEIIKYISQVPDLKLMNEKLVLPVNDAKFNEIKSTFLAGFGALISASCIIGIYCNPFTNNFANAKLQSFQNQIEITRRKHGIANVRRAWFPVAKGALEIMLHGFGHIELPSCRMAHGIGVHLLPANCSPISANFVDGDENHVQHMVLCRVIMGNMEQVPQGSKQFQPSNEEFDSGVDDIEKPNYYIVWNCHMNTHIYPEYLVSFVVPPDSKGRFAGVCQNHCKHELSQATNLTHHRDQSASPQQLSSTIESGERTTSGHSLRPSKAPTSAWMSFPMLLDAISTKISSSNKNLVDTYYHKFKCKNIARDDFIKKLRSIVGDEVLISTLKSFKCKSPGIAKPEIDD
ncbi:inactive poly [ADP-ribose] polymerase RCD1-like isoform X2 [Nymphaea colorata]|uniref:inactive poly [ADP-ribose] polymerase RCD1-like isoform X2 n=1 Tax=Nymphaea colorata TaxID=210225 RepID=UPI00129D3DE6|nr:inactive poly [ADP-ribose] polymerase RCD1-like isoform X2 [Nymphaea colorata]